MLVTGPKNADDSEDQERPARAAECGSPNSHQGAPFLHGVGRWPLSKPLNREQPGGFCPFVALGVPRGCLGELWQLVGELALLPEKKLMAQVLSCL